MPTGNTLAANRSWGWRLAAGVFGIALVIDVVDGPWLKAASSALFLVCCLLLGVTRAPRNARTKTVAIALAMSAIVLIGYRILGPGL